MRPHLSPREGAPVETPSHPIDAYSVVTHGERDVEPPPGSVTARLLERMSRRQSRRWRVGHVSAEGAGAGGRRHTSAAVDSIGCSKTGGAPASLITGSRITSARSQACMRSAASRCSCSARSVKARAAATSAATSGTCGSLGCLPFTTSSQVVETRSEAGVGVQAERAVGEKVMVTFHAGAVMGNSLE